MPSQQPEQIPSAEIGRILSEAIQLEADSGPEEAVNLVAQLIRRLHQSGQYGEVAKLFGSQICQDYEGSFRTFEIAYALNECGSLEKAGEIYEELSYADHPDPAVLNNLGVIRQKEGKLRESIRLFRRAAKLDPDKKLYKNNMVPAENELSEQVRLKSSYMEAAETVRKENEYVVGRLLLFYNNATGDPDYCKGRIPMPRWKFNKMAGLPDNRADAVLGRWVEKGYLRDTGESGRYNERVYELNPYLHKELARLRPVKVKPEWVTGFENVTGGNLAEFGYAEIKERIAKVRAKYRIIMDRDIDELALNRLMGQRKAVVALAGALVELALMYFCERKNITTLCYQVGQKMHKKKLYDCDLGDLLRYFQQTRTLSDLDVAIGHVARIHRNYIHPGKELRDKEGLSETKAALCFNAAMEVLNRLLPK